MESLDFVSEFELAYIAGIIDGEGSVGLYRQTERWKGKEYRYQRGYLSIANTNRILLYWVLSKLGEKGHISVQRHGGLFSTHPSTVYQLAWQGKRAKNVALKVLPYLRLKKERAEKMIAFQMEKRERGSLCL